MRLRDDVPCVHGPNRKCADIGPACGWQGLSMHKGRYCKGSGGKNEKAVYDENDQAVKTEDAMDLVDSAQGAVRAPGKRISLPPAQLKSSMLRCAAAALGMRLVSIGDGCQVALAINGGTEVLVPFALSGGLRASARLGKAGDVVSIGRDTSVGSGSRRSERVSNDSVISEIN